MKTATYDLYATVSALFGWKWSETHEMINDELTTFLKSLPKNCSLDEMNTQELCLMYVLQHASSKRKKKIRNKC